MGKNLPKLVSTVTGREYPFATVAEFTPEGHSLEVNINQLESARVREAGYIWQRFSDFLPFSRMDESYSLGEGNTPLLRAGPKLESVTGLSNLWLKDETRNPTGSFKDRGSLTSLFMAAEMSESVTATISTGNMGHSVSAFAGRAGITSLVFVPHYTPREKLMAMAVNGAKILKVRTPDYSIMKSQVLKLAESHSLRVVSGNGPIRVEGYKLTAFELWEQMQARIPDYIAVPTSACGHIRGIFKGFRELKKAGLSNRLPKMIVVQPANNNPLVNAIKNNFDEPVPVTNVQTIAKALSSGDPPGGAEILEKSRTFNWLAEEVTEAEIIESQRLLARSGFFVEPASATSLFALKKLRQNGKIEKNAFIVLVLTGSGLKDMDVLKRFDLTVPECSLEEMENRISSLISRGGRSLLS